VRTTLTIDDDVARLLEQDLKRSGESLKGAVNDALRRGLQDRRKPLRKKKFVVKPLPLNLARFGFGTEYHKVEQLLDVLDGPLRR